MNAQNTKQISQQKIHLVTESKKHYETTFTGCDFR